MSYRVPLAKAEDVIRALEKASFERCGYTTSHVCLKRSTDGKRMVLPIPARALSPKTLKGILNDAGLTVPEFLALR